MGERFPNIDWYCEIVSLDLMTTTMYGNVQNVVIKTASLRTLFINQRKTFVMSISERRKQK